MDARQPRADKKPCLNKKASPNKKYFPNKKPPPDKKPRSKEDRLLHRFYESLIILHVLDRNGDKQPSPCPSVEGKVSPTELRGLKRNFLNQLAYVCDHEKGGDTVTAIALEKQCDGVKFWVASNESSKKTVDFLYTILSILKRLAFPGVQHSTLDMQEQIIDICVKYNCKRIQAYQVLMRTPFKKCLKYLETSGLLEDKELAEWLEKFQDFKELHSLCRFAYEQRSSKCLRQLQRHIGDETPLLNNIESRRESFLLTRHYIGRLGSHVKAAKVLTEAAHRLPGLFENFSINDRRSSKSSSFSLSPDHLTTLSGIVTRMLHSTSVDLERYQEALRMLDSKFQIQDRVSEQYQKFQDEKFKPRVHAELALLEFFHAKRLDFFDDDRFIGCSKPACYCCYNYIRFHPGAFELPPSHGIRYLKWRPPDLINPSDEQEKKFQRDVMDRLIAQIRRDALRHIDLCKGPSAWHPDSTTGISQSQKLSASAFCENEIYDSDTPATPDEQQAEEGECASADHVELCDTSELDSDSDGGVVLQ